MVVFANDASSEEVSGNLLNNIPELKLVGKVRRDGAAAKQDSHDVAAYGSGGIAVSGVVYAAHDGILERVPMFGGAVDSDCKRLVARPDMSSGSKCRCGP